MQEALRGQAYVIRMCTELQDLAQATLHQSPAQTDAHKLLTSFQTAYRPMNMLTCRKSAAGQCAF